MNVIPIREIESRKNVVVLSPAQRDAAVYLCVLRSGPAYAIIAATGCTEATLDTLVALGLAAVTTAGRRDALYFLTDAGREAVCREDDDVADLERS